MLALQITNLHKTYKSGAQALRGVDLEVNEGEFFALLGPNGAGKTTMIGIISSLVTKTNGKVRVLGIDLDQDPAGVRAKIGLVPQEVNFNLFERVIDIVVNQGGYYGVPRSVALEKAESLFHELDLWQYRFSTARALSGGFKRRLMIARALIHDPPLLILDEPTAGVDIELRRSMWEYLRRINREGKTIILTTHYLEEAESLCRKIAIIQGGHLVEQGDMQQLLHSLHKETFVLDLKDRLEKPPELPGFQVRLTGEKTLEIDIDHSHSINEAFALLTECGITALSLRNKANRLEEIFINLLRDPSRAH